jgi:hypothetical protein
MDKEKMLEKMCASGLSQADIKAICKIRNLPPACLTSRELFRYRFLAEPGIEKIFASLDQKQILFLHLLNATGKATDIESFTRLYPKAHPGAYGYSFNDQYKGVFKRVRTELIRKGLLLYAEAPEDGWNKTTLLERQRFMFPDDFAPFLPSPVVPVRIEEHDKRILRKDTLRDKLAEILDLQKASDSQSSASRSGSIEGKLHIKGGKLFLGKLQFTIKRLKSWNRSRWVGAVGIKTKSGDSTLSPVDFVTYALSFLEERYWAAADDILPLWQIAYPAAEKLPDARSVHEQGWEHECLEKVAKDGKFFYRLQKIDTGQDNREPNRFLSIPDDELIEIDLARTPLDTLEWLCGLCHVSVLQGRLTATPDLVKISHATEQIKQNPTFAWLQKHHRAFGRIVRTIKQRQGKTVVHSNLMIARIGDLSLKVQLEKKFADSKKVVSLSDEFISFPVNLFPEIRKAVTKSGHAVKLVESDGNN